MIDLLNLRGKTRMTLRFALKCTTLANYCTTIVKQTFKSRSTILYSIQHIRKNFYLKSRLNSIAIAIVTFLLPFKNVLNSLRSFQLFSITLFQFQVTIHYFNCITGCFEKDLPVIATRRLFEVSNFPKGTHEPNVHCIVVGLKTL